VIYKSRQLYFIHTQTSASRSDSLTRLTCVNATPREQN